MKQFKSQFILKTMATDSSNDYEIKVYTFQTLVHKHNQILVHGYIRQSNTNHMYIPDPLVTICFYYYYYNHFIQQKQVLLLPCKRFCKMGVNKFRNANIVIKTYNKSLYRNQMAVSGGTYWKDIISEATITKYITESKGAPKSIAKYYDFFQCKYNFYMVLEHGGDDLFAFVNKAHRFISNGTLDIFEWHSAVKVIFLQMIEAIEFIHSKNVCHFDISLENFLIND
eukprot:324903_1